MESTAMNEGEVKKRQHWMSILSRSNADELQQYRNALQLSTAMTYLRKPETGLVMVRGRAGGIGQRFNLGEATVTRCSIKLASGQIGHAYIMGRHKRHAELAALFDGCLQSDQWQARIEQDVIAVIEERLKKERLDKETKIAATKVDFFTMTRGENL